MSVIKVTLSSCLQMLLPSILLHLVLPLLATPLLPGGAEDGDHHVAEERQFEAVADILGSETDAEYLDEDVDSRLLTSGTAGLIGDPKGITYKTAGTDTTQSSQSFIFPTHHTLVRY